MRAAKRVDPSGRAQSRTQFAASVAELVRQMNADEIDAFVAALLPDVDEDERDEWFAQIIHQQRKGRRSGKTLKAAFADLERIHRPHR